MFLQMCLGRFFAYVGPHFVSIVHAFISKEIVELNVKLFNVNIIFRKLMITFVLIVFCFSVALAALTPSILGTLV